MVGLVPGPLIRNEGQPPAASGLSGSGSIDTGSTTTSGKSLSSSDNNLNWESYIEKATPFHAPDLPNGMVLGLAIGAIFGGCLLLILLFFIAYRKCGDNRKKDMSDLYFEEVSCCKSSKSEPSTRQSSPILRRTSPPSVAERRAVLIRTLTVDQIPDFELPPERVQPRSPHDKNKHTHQTALQFQHSLLETLQTELYHSISVDSEDSEETSPAPSSGGRVWYSVVYDAAVEVLSVHVIKAKYLKPRPKTGGPRDPFFKVFLLPDERDARETRVRKKTLAPKFNETFTFNIGPLQLAARTVRLSLYDVDKRRVRQSLGHVLVSLADTDLTAGDTMWRDLEPLSKGCGQLGELNLTMNYVGTPTERLKVGVIRARGLRKVDPDTQTGCFVRLQLVHGQRVLKTKKTVAIVGTSEPNFNESFSFTVPFKQLDSCSVVAAVVQSNGSRLGGGAGEEEYGKVVVGSFMYARGDELQHWQDMIAEPRATIARWHHLCPVDKPSTD